MSDPDPQPLPRLDDENAPFWTAAHNHELRLQRCLDCSRWRFPASRWCPSCRGERSEWAMVSGTGRVHSYCRFHKAYFPELAHAVPYNVVLVELDEGPKLYSNLIDIGHDEVEIGMAVEVCFEPVTDAVVLPQFRPLRAR